MDRISVRFAVWLVAIMVSCGVYGARERTYTLNNIVNSMASLAYINELQQEMYSKWIKAHSIEKSDPELQQKLDDLFAPMATQKLFRSLSQQTKSGSGEEGFAHQLEQQGFTFMSTTWKNCITNKSLPIVKDNVFSHAVIADRVVKIDAQNPFSLSSVGIWQNILRVWYADRAKRILKAYGVTNIEVIDGEALYCASQPRYTQNLVLATLSRKIDMRLKDGELDPRETCPKSVVGFLKPRSYFDCQQGNYDVHNAVVIEGRCRILDAEPAHFWQFSCISTRPRGLPDNKFPHQAFKGDPDNLILQAELDRGVPALVCNCGKHTSTASSSSSSSSASLASRPPAAGATPSPTIPVTQATLTPLPSSSPPPVPSLYSGITRTHLAVGGAVVVAAGVVAVRHYRKKGQQQNNEAKNKALTT